MIVKKLIVAVAALASAAVLNAQDSVSLADARASIGDCIKTPAKMTETMKKLSAEDQKAFLAEVNEAIAAMPGSNEAQAATFLNVNRAALKGSKPGNLENLVAEVFATVPPESLTAINESFAAGMFNRKADPSKTYTDDQYVQISTNLLAVVQERNATADNAGVRNTFAILMLIRGSEGSPADLRDTLVGSLNDAETRLLAQNEWLSPALGQGQEKSYDPMLGAADAGNQPDLNMVLISPFSSSADALLSDLASERSTTDGSSSVTALVAPAFADQNTLDVADGVDPLSSNASLSRLPRTMDPNAKYNPGYKRGEPVDYP